MVIKDFLENLQRAAKKKSKQCESSSLATNEIHIVKKKILVICGGDVLLLETWI